MIRVLFVCLGNICRSPMAEGVFQQLVIDEGLGDQIMVDSAGTSGFHAGERAHGGTRKILQEHSIHYDGRSRQLSRLDFSDFDYLLAMDNSNLSNIKRMMPDNSPATVVLFLNYATQTTETEVPDPYYSGGFDYVYELIEDAARGFLKHLRETHNL